MTFRSGMSHHRVRDQIGIRFSVLSGSNEEVSVFAGDVWNDF